MLEAQRRRDFACWRGGGRAGRCTVARVSGGQPVRARLQLNELRKAGGGGTERARRELSDGCCCDGDAKGR